MSLSTFSSTGIDFYESMSVFDVSEYMEAAIEVSEQYGKQ